MASYLDGRTPEQQVAISEAVKADRAAARDADPKLQARYERTQEETAARLQRVQENLAWRASHPEEAAAQDAAESERNRIKAEEAEQRDAYDDPDAYLYQ